jgi:hypothetical protein
MKVVLKQIRNDKAIADLEKDGYQFFYAFVGTGLTLMLVILSPFPIFVSLIIGLALVFIVRPQVRKLYGDFAKEKDYVGDVVFEDDKISWQEGDDLKSVVLGVLASIEIHHNFVQGQAYVRRDIIHNGLAEIKLVGNDGSEHKFKFVIHTSDQIEALRLCWKHYYCAGINVKEFMGNGRIKSVLFSPIPMGHAERQALKDELKIDRFYN